MGFILGDLLRSSGGFGYYGGYMGLFILIFIGFLLVQFLIMSLLYFGASKIIKNEHSSFLSAIKLASFSVLLSLAFGIASPFLDYGYGFGDDAMLIISLLAFAVSTFLHIKIASLVYKIGMRRAFFLIAIAWGFILIPLGIFFILAVLPRMMSSQERSVDLGSVADLNTLAQAIETYYDDYGNYPGEIGKFNCLNDEMEPGKTLREYLRSNMIPTTAKSKTFEFQGGECVDEYGYAHLSDGYILLSHMNTYQNSNMDLTALDQTFHSEVTVEEIQKIGNYSLQALKELDEADTIYMVSFMGKKVAKNYNSSSNYNSSNNSSPYSNPYSETQKETPEVEEIPNPEGYCARTLDCNKIDETCIDNQCVKIEEVPGMSLGIECQYAKCKGCEIGKPRISSTSIPDEDRILFMCSECVEGRDKYGSRCNEGYRCKGRKCVAN